jgi:thioredoxin reductase (NADPH)
MVEYDVVIIGAGPAGLTAGIYASRRALKALIISQDIGGQVVTTTWIENYPGFTKIKAVELIDRFVEHVRHFGVEIKSATVTEIREENKQYVVKTGKEEYRCKAVVLAFGKSPRTLDVPGEKEFTGKGISYCTICDGALFKNKIIAIVGGGNSALEGALFLSGISSKVYLIHRRDEFRGFESSVEKVKKKKNVEFILNSVISEFKGDKFLKTITVENINTHEKKEMKIDGVFIEIGSEVKTDLIKDLVKIDENKHVVINHNCETFYPNSDKIRPGIFAAGDVTFTPFKQIVISAGEGAKASLQAYNYIHGIETKGIVGDWSAGKK